MINQFIEITLSLIDNETACVFTLCSLSSYVLGQIDFDDKGNLTDMTAKKN